MPIIKVLILITFFSSCNKENQQEVVQVISNKQSSIDRGSSESSETMANKNLIGKWSSKSKNIIYDFQKSGNVEEISDCSNSDDTATVKIRRVTKYKVSSDGEVTINPFPSAKSRVLKAHENQNKTNKDFVCEKNDDSKEIMKAVLNNAESLKILGRESLIKL